MVKLLDRVSVVVCRLGVTFPVITKMCLQTEVMEEVFAVGSDLIFVSPSPGQVQNQVLSLERISLNHTVACQWVW